MTPPLTRAILMMALLLAACPERDTPEEQANTWLTLGHDPTSVSGTVDFIHDCLGAGFMVAECRFILERGMPIKLKANPLAIWDEACGQVERCREGR